MCTDITLILPDGADTGRLRGVLEARGRRLEECESSDIVGTGVRAGEALGSWHARQDSNLRHSA